MNPRNLLRALPIAVAALSTFLIAGCETVDTRIQQNAAVYQRLSPQDQELVRQGQIRSGMPQSAVYIAWGAPQNRTVANVHGRPAETWVYTSEHTVYPYPYGFGGGYGPGFGLGFYGGGGRLYTRHGHRYYGFGYDPFFDPFFGPAYNPHIEYPSRTVSFQNGRVVAFQFLAPPGYH